MLDEIAHLPFLRVLQVGLAILGALERVIEDCDDVVGFVARAGLLLSLSLVLHDLRPSEFRDLRAGRDCLLAATKRLKQGTSSWLSAKRAAPVTGPWKRMVGETGFEPATLCSQSRCATRLRHSPTIAAPKADRDARQSPGMAAGRDGGPGRI